MLRPILEQWASPPGLALDVLGQESKWVFGQEPKWEPWRACGLYLRDLRDMLNREVKSQIAWVSDNTRGLNLRPKYWMMTIIMVKSSTPVGLHGSSHWATSSLKQNSSGSCCIVSRIMTNSSFCLRYNFLDALRYLTGSAAIPPLKRLGISPCLLEFTLLFNSHRQSTSQSKISELNKGN